MEDKVEKTSKWNRKKKEFKNDDSLRELRDKMKHNNIHIIEVPGGEERDQGINNLFKGIITQNFPNFMKRKDTQVWEARDSQTR